MKYKIESTIDSETGSKRVSGHIEIEETDFYKAANRIIGDTCREWRRDFCC